MGIGGGIFLVAIGAILAFTVHADFAWLDVHVVGWVLMLSGPVPPEPPDAELPAGPPPA